MKNNDLNVFKRMRMAVNDFFYGISVAVHNAFTRRKPKSEASGYSVSKERKRAKIKELLCIWSFLIIPIINLCVFWVYGTIQSFPIAFEHNFVDGTKTYDLFNFKYIIEHFFDADAHLFESLKNTLIYWCFGAFFMQPLSFLMSFFLYKKITGYRFFRYVFFIPSIISSVIISAFFKQLFGPRGQMEALFQVLFGQKISFFADSRYAFKTLLFYSFYTGLTGNMIYWLAAFARIPQEIVEAGQIDGLSTLQEFRHISFPLVLPFLATMYLLMFTGILDASGAALLLTGGDYGTYDMGYYLYKYTISGGLNDQGLSGAVGLLKGLIILPFTLLINRFVNKIEAVEY